MPIDKGTVVVERLNEMFKKKEDRLPIILLHNSSEEAEVIPLANQYGIKYRLSKPIKSSELLESITSIQNSNITLFNRKKSLKNSNLSQFDKENRVKILIVEDVPLNLELATKFILKIIPTSKIITAKNGREGFEKFQSEAPHLVFMDVQMPEMDGYESTRKIRNLPYGKEIPIIALTAGVVSGEKEKCIQAGMNDFLSKPISRDELRGVIEKYLTSKTV